MKDQNVESVVELSPLQQGMFFHTLYAPGSGVYVVQLSVRLEGRLDPPVFARAWQHVVDRHAALRSSFFWEELEKPVQVVERQVEVPLDHRSWCDLSRDEQQQRLADYVRADRERGFDLSAAPLMRLALFELDDETFQLVWSFHHINLDGWSYNLVLGEVFHCYAAFSERRPVELAGSRPYRHYIAWLQQQDLGEAQRFWRNLLQALLAKLRQYEFTPLERIGQWSELAAGSALFDNILVFENYPMDAAREQSSQDLKLSDFHGAERTNYPMTVAVGPGPPPAMKFLYECRTFDDTAVLRLRHHYENLLHGLAADPAQLRLGEVPMLAAAERQQLVTEWNDVARSFPRDATLHALFEAQAERTPEAVAVVFEQHLSYRELNRRANRLADHLRAWGVGREELIAIYLERSPATVVAILAVVKAGGVYLPLDLSSPPERLAFMLEDAAAPVLVTCAELAATLPAELAERGVKLVCLDRDAAVIARRSERNPHPAAAVGAQHLAYVIYTSGSTGRPKGIGVSHRAVARLVVNTDYVSLGPGDRVAQASTTSFDAATFELWGALLHGARLVGISKRVAIAPPALAAALRAQGITTLFLTTALFNQMAQEDPAAFAGLRHLLFGGEAVDPGWVREVLCRFPGRLLHVYGPTESTTFTTWQRVREVPAGARTVPIGSPIANTEVYVLDRSLEPVPVGVAGELLAGGDGLARGYAGRAQLSAEKFVPHPFAARPGERLYRTGDLVRTLPEGSIEFLGRIDHQVKLRGFRVELGEIEAVLSSHGGVRESVVLVRDEIAQGGGPARLVAYVVADREPRPAVRELRQFLNKDLPDYMVPSAFVFLDALPLLPNGKVNRRALPAPAPSEVSPEGEFVAPGNPTEELLAGIWEEVLGVTRVGVHDNFFELGGHSLMATQVASRVRETFAVEVPLDKLFEAPTLTELAAIVDAAQLGKRGLEAPPMVAVARDREFRDGVPLSFAQQRLWFFHQWEPGSSAYNIPATVRLSGAVAAAIIERIFNEVVRRHEALRTTFTTSGERPVQVIAERLRLPLPVADLERLPEPRRRAEARRLADEEAQRLFDLTVGPLVRVTLLRLAEEDHVLLVTMHHIVSDGWSMGIFIRELSVLFEAFSLGNPSPLAELPLQYADFAHWQRRWLSGEVLEAEAAYWRERLVDAPVLELPTDRPRPPSSTSRGAHLSLALPAGLSERLEKLVLEQDVTLFMILLAGFGALLSRITGQHDLCVGTPIANRTHKQLEGLIGFFVNTLVLRIDTSDRATSDREGPRFTELLQRLREVALQAYAHQNLPFERLVEELDLARDPSRTPLYQVMFALQNTPTETFELPDLTLEPVAVEIATAAFDLTLSFTRTPNGLHYDAEYNTDLFDDTTIRRLGHHFSRVLAGIADDPGMRLRELALLSEAEHHQLRLEWNDHAASVLRKAWIPQLFEAQVAQIPETVAVSSAQRNLSYRELNHRANQLAYQLESRGIGPETRVGVCMERSPEMVISFLAILKAGATYVPLDPTYPRARLAFMLEDAGVALVLTQERLLDRLPAPPPPVVCPATDREAAGGSRENPIPRSMDSDRTTAPEPLPDSVCVQLRPAKNPRFYGDTAAYLLYTSGSTGEPKGVVISHHAIRNYLLWMQEVLPLTPADRVLQTTPFTFDVSVCELWAPLLAGARVVLARPGGHRDASYLTAEIRRRRISILQMVPSLLRSLLDQSEFGRCHELRRIFCGAESLSSDLLARYEADGPPAELLNMYGPTEATIDTTFARCRPTAGSRATVPIGRPLANVEVDVLDEHLQPLPVGAAGELVIGGAGLARGYLERPATTAERFIPNFLSPSIEDPGGRLYRTGDLVRHLADGTIEFLGRIDDQVKIRGFRIELGEIEAVLSRHSGVRETAVMLREDLPGDPRLVAYVVPDREPVPGAEGLRELMKTTLPEFMVPSAFVFLEALPLMPHGKVDRRALPAPQEPREAREEDFVAPADPTEELLAGIWAEVLHREKVGAGDNFFELGGHSLLATQVISRIRKTFEVDLPLQSLFEAPTPAELARIVHSARQEAPGVAAPPLVPVGRDQELPLSFAQQRLWFVDQIEPGIPAYNMPTALRLSGAVTVARLEGIFNALIRRHEVLRTTFPATSGRPRQVIAPRLDLPLPLVELGRPAVERREAEARRLTAEEAQRPFDLKVGPLIRFTLVRLAPQDHLLLVTMHHIVSDGWSMGIFFRELTALYAAASRAAAGPPPALPELSIQYADFAHWQRRWLAGEALEAETAYWRRQLAGAPQHPELPTDRPRPPIQTFRGRSWDLALSEELSRALAALSREHDVTLFMALLAAFNTLLHRYTGREDIVVGIPIAGRNRREIEGLIGFFVNTLVLRTDLSGSSSRGPTYRQLLTRVRQVVLDADAHQDLPFEQLVDELQPERDLSSHPLFQVVFAWQDFPIDAYEAPGLSLSTPASEATTAKFDLTLGMDQGEHRIVGSLEYNTDLFDRATIRRLAIHLKNLLADAAGDPEKHLSDLSLLSPAESHQLSAEWNDSRSDDPQRRRPLQELFELWAERTPDAPAVVFEDRYLSYRELDRRANQLARHLRGHGVGPEVLVGICVGRSPEMVVGILGVLKAGGAWLPLDPGHPRERLAFMISETRVGVILTREHLRGALPENETRILCLDSAWDTVASESSARFASGVTAENAAYVIYTSGSTGQPKGVVVVHRGLTNFCEVLARLVGTRPEDRILQFSSLSFDASVLELAMALPAGASLHLAPRQALLPGAPLLELLRACRITATLLPPTALAMMEDDDLPELSTLLVGGEACSSELARQWFAGRRFINAYGPTETTVCATAGPYFGGRRLSIGTPIANTRVHLLGRHLEIVPIGVPGELYAGGPSVSRGYLQRPGPTAERFVPDPCLDGARLYRTGDLARYLPDGTIEFLGRIDHQVKVRGFRIELGEIEAVLSTHPAVRKTAVLAREEGGEGDTADRRSVGRRPPSVRLVAYVTTDPDYLKVAEPVPELRRFLGEKLPDYMVPAAFVVLEAFPLTASGKIDRRALPAPERSRPELEEAFVAPRTPAEETLARIWSQLLAVERAGVHDNFFDLGGDSILGIQVVTRAQEAGLRLSPKDLFQYQTIAELAAVAGAATPLRADQGTVTGELPLTPIQRWFFELRLPEPHHFNQAVLLEVGEALDSRRLERALAALEEHHDALRLRFLREQAGWRQLNAAPGGAVPLVRVNLSAQPDERRRAAVTEVASGLQASLDLGRGPLWRAALFDLGPDRAGRLLWVIHHLAVDGVSWRVLLEDLERTVRQLERGEPITLPPKTESFKGWAERLHEYAGSEAAHQEPAWWLAEPGTRTSPLPADFRGGVNTVASARTVSVAFEADETRSLLREVPAAYHTQVNDLLLTALLQAFARWTGTPTLLVDLEGHGREELFAGVDVSRTVGWFTTIYPVLLERRKASGPGEDLMAVKEQLRAVPNGGIGYGLLRYLSTDEETAERFRRLPRAEVSFNYLGQLDPVLSESALLRPAAESSGPATGSGGLRSHLLEVNGGVAGGCLRMTWAYSENVHHRATVESVAEGFIEALRSLIRHCLSPEAGGYTPADFPDAGLDQEDLDELFAQLSDED